MKTSPQGIALIKRFEGFSAMPYLCPAGLKTVGYGHVIRASERGEYPLSEADAERLLRADIAVAERAVARLIAVPLTQGQYDALVSFTFNLGAAALQRSRLRQVINRGEHAAVPAQLLRWVYGGGRVLKGLVARRQAEAAMYSILPPLPH